MKGKFKRITRITKITAAVTACILMAALSGCGGKEEAGPKAEYVYRAAPKEISEEIKGDITGFCSTLSAGKVCFLSSYPNEEEEYYEYYINTVNVDGSGFSAFWAGEGRMTDPCCTAEGKLCWFAEEYEGEQSRFLIKTADTGGGNITETDVSSEIDDSFYAAYFGIDRSGNYIIGNWNGITVIGSDFKFKFDIRNAGDVSDIVFDKAGNAYIYGYGDGGMTLCAIDTETGETGKETLLPAGDYGSLITPGNDSDFLICSGSVVYSYNIGGEAEEIFGLVESGVSAIEVSTFFYGSEGYIFAGQSYPYNAPKISLVTKQPAPENDRKEIILAGNEYSVSAYIENEAVKFNNLSDDYFITVKKYGYADYDRMNMDIISGNIPDILISGSGTPINNYISKGMFADLYEFIDSDPDFSREDFIPSLLAACETDGKLYRFTDSFRIYTLLGKEKIFGNEMLTFDRLCEIVSKYPDNTEVFPGCTKYDLLYAAMDFGYIDYENAEYGFDSEQFIKLLEYSDKLSDNIDLDDYFNDEFWSRFETMYSDESALLMTAYLSDFTDLYRFERAQFADPVSAVGFPRQSGSGTAFMLQTGISVSAKADEKTREGAWQFVKRLLAPDYQNCVSEFPVRNDSLKKLAERDMEHDPKRVNYGIVTMGTMSLSSAVSDIGEPNEEDVQRVMDIIASADCILREDMTVNDIIAEEAAEFYNGSKTAEETAELVRMRIRLYLTEQA